MEADMATASPMKLKSGEWGARVQGAARQGDIITIVTKAGKTWQARVERVLWTGDGVAICATSSLDRSGPSRRGYGPGRCIECGDAGRLGTGCTGDPRRCYDCDS
jgi:hypothetical protein